MSLIDVVNFNPDASCLDSFKWLCYLENGTQSRLMQMLRNYVTFQRKVNLGLTGAAIRDLAYFHPESIKYIQAHPETFQLIIRPFAHDSPLLRLPEGFAYNLTQGIQTIQTYFTNFSPYYLAPEIMTTGEQIAILKRHGIEGIFVHRYRYDKSTRMRVQAKPFIVWGTQQTAMLCVPFTEKSIENIYLSSLHGVIDPRIWCRSIMNASENDLYIWRDGESCLLFPLGIEFEARIFEMERQYGIERKFLSELSLTPSCECDSRYLKYFPMHSMHPWMKEMKLYWYISRVRDIEETLDELSATTRLAWLLTINSDILSSVEKTAPIIRVAKEVFAAERNDFVWIGVIPFEKSAKLTLARSERAGEAEDYLLGVESLRKEAISPKELMTMWRQAAQPHLQKALARVFPEAHVTKD